MKPKWIDVGGSKKDIFDILRELENGKSIRDIANENQLEQHEIRNLLMRTRSYLQNHLILDSYMEMTNRLDSALPKTIEIEWSSSEIRELVELKISGASIENISHIMRKPVDEIKKKLESLNMYLQGD